MKNTDPRGPVTAQPESWEMSSRAVDSVWEGTQSRSHLLLGSLEAGEEVRHGPLLPRVAVRRQVERAR